MGSLTVDSDQVAQVDWSRYTIDVTVEGSKAHGLKLSETDLSILLKLLDMTVQGESVTSGSGNLQNLREVFKSMKAHLVRRRG